MPKLRDALRENCGRTSVENTALDLVAVQNVERIAVMSSNQALNVLCNTCRVNASRSTHYSSVFHRYNVKRKCAGLLPVSLSAFEIMLERTKAQEASQTPVAPEDLRCIPCHKSFRSLAARQSHMGSKKHKKAAANLGRKPSANDTNDSSALEPVPVAREHPVPLGSCLFCTRDTFDSVQECVEHMTSQHGFFIPYVEFLVDLEGLLSYLGFKVGMGHVCVHCNGRKKAAYPSLEAVRSHMEAKSHCKMRWEPSEEDDDEEFEYDEFYDFGAEVDVDMIDDVECKTVSLPSAGNGVRAVASVNDLGELVMSDGSIIGHRAHNHLYKQRASHDYELKHLLASRYKLLGFGSTSTKEETAAQRKGQLKHMRYLQSRHRLDYRSHKLHEHFKTSVSM